MRIKRLIGILILLALISASLGCIGSSDSEKAKANLPDLQKSIRKADEYANSELNALISNKLAQKLSPGMSFAYEKLLKSLIKTEVVNLKWTRIEPIYSCDFYAYAPKGCVIPYYSTLNYTFLNQNYPIKFNVEIVVEDKLFEGYKIRSVYLTGIRINDEDLLVSKDNYGEVYSEILLYP